MVRLPKVATPPLAAAVVIPLSVPLLGLSWNCTETLEPSLVTRLLNSSNTCTVTAGVMFTPDVVVLICPTNDRCVAAAGLTKMASLVPLMLLLPVSVKVRVCMPACLSVALKVAEPFVIDTGMPKGGSSQATKFSMAARSKRTETFERDVFVVKILSSAPITSLFEPSMAMCSNVGTVVCTELIRLPLLSNSEIGRLLSESRAKMLPFLSTAIEETEKKPSSRLTC